MNIIRVAIFLAGLPAAAQSIGAHLMAGIPVTEFDHSCCAARFFSLESFTNRYDLGAGLELRFHTRLAVETDVIYQHMHLVGNCCVILPDAALRASGNSWQIPFLVKYRLIERAIAPYIEAGPSIRWNTFSGVLITYPPGVATRQQIHENRRIGAGILVGGGIELEVQPLRFISGVRYSRYGDLRCDACSRISTTFPSVNQVSVMLA